MRSERLDNKKKMTQGVCCALNPRLQCHYDCGTLYCSEACARKHWTQGGHARECGKPLRESNPLVIRVFRQLRDYVPFLRMLIERCDNVAHLCWLSQTCKLFYETLRCNVRFLRVLVSERLGLYFDHQDDGHILWARHYLFRRGSYCTLVRPEGGGQTPIVYSTLFNTRTRARDWLLNAAIQSTRQVAYLKGRAYLSYATPPPAKGWHVAALVERTPASEEERYRVANEMLHAFKLLPRMIQKRTHLTVIRPTYGDGEYIVVSFTDRK